MIKDHVRLAARQGCLPEGVTHAKQGLMNLVASRPRCYRHTPEQNAHLVERLDAEQRLAEPGQHVQPLRLKNENTVQVTASSKVP